MWKYRIVAFLLISVAGPSGGHAQPIAPKSVGTSAGTVLVVDHPGVIEVTAAAMADGLQTSRDDVANLIRTGWLDLRLGGQSIAWHAVDVDLGIRFVAPAVRSPFSSEHRYLLFIEEGIRMEEPGLVRSEALEPHVFLASARFEENVFPGVSGVPDPRQDLFFWHTLSAEAQVLIPVSLPAIGEPSARELRVHIHGATKHPEQPHRVELHWNGQSLGAFDLFGRTRHTIVTSLDGLPAALENQLVVQQHVAGDELPVVYLDRVEVDYLALAEANASAFWFGGATDGVHMVTGLPSETTLLYDVTQPNAPKHYGETSLEEPGRLGFMAGGSDLRFLAATPASVSGPVAVNSHLPRNLRSSAHNVDYLIIAASHLTADAQELADLRQADGYRVLLVDIDEVYWAFADGESDPLAVRDFLSFAWQQWQTAPRFAVLIGKGNLDYRDLIGLGGNSLPPALAETDGGLFPSDSILGDVVGDDGVPEIAIGRLPIVDGEELGRIIDSIEWFEANHESMDALFAADDSEHGEFAAASQLLTDWVLPERAQEIDLNIESREDARDRLFSIWGSLSWMSYVGHSGIDRMASEGLVTLADVPALAETANAPIVVGWTCNMVRFDIPGFSSLGEQLLTEGASAGVFSATGWSNHFETDFLRTGFTEAVFASEAETIGEAILRAHQGATDASVPQHRVFTLLGDPALRLRVAKSPPDPDPEPVQDLPSANETGEPDAPPASHEGPPSSASGCEIRPPGAGDGPLGPWLLILGLALLIRRRRA